MVQTPGGGYDPPAAREREQVEEDVRNGKVTATQAAKQH
ncbi:MAG: hypothetical protein GKR94_30185 [Gammaproteobacteria bacterium]|nr:hypothetical protein [Gammaproteobacteria bacterium]